MLTPEEWDFVARQASKIYANLELEIIQEIAERIANVGYANTVALNDVLIAQEMGLLYQDIIVLVAKYNESSINKVIEIFENAGAKSLEFDDSIYKEAGLNPLPLKQSKEMLDLLLATAIKTNNNLSNLTLTIAKTFQTDFYNAMNKAYLEVSTGVKSYSSAILDAINDIGKNGAYIEYPSGRKYSLESAVRMNVLTSVNQTCGKLQEMRADEMGWDLMEITAHPGARPEHAEWQGKIVSRSGENKKYLSLEDIGYGEATGFKGVNCRHDWYPYYEGSTRTYSDAELRKLKNEKVTYNGKKISKYEASQIQRKIEKIIRQDKKDIAALNGIINKATDNKLIEDTRTAFARKSLIYKTHQSELDSLIKQIVSKKDTTRLYIGKQDGSIMSQIANVTKIANKYNKDILGIVLENNLEVKGISEHIISRTYAREVSYDDVINALKNPIKYGKIRADDSMQIKGANCTVIINVKTGKLVTVYPKKTKKE